MTERWEPIYGYEGLYSVSSLGRVRSEPRTISTVRGPRRMKGKILSNAIVDSGHAVVELYNGEGSLRKYVHRLVAEAFILNYDDLPLVVHGENGVSDNSIENLSWGNGTKNNLDRVRDQTDHNSNKVKCPRGHSYTGKNLNKYQKPSGWWDRRCRSCASAHSYLRRHPESSETLQQVSDRYYAKWLDTHADQA